MPTRKPRTKAGKKAVMKEDMGRFKRGTLRSGSRTGPVVKKRSQAQAIALSESGQSNRGKKARNKRLAGAEL